MVSKIRIKIGRAELEFEGSEEFMRNDLVCLIEALDSFAPTVPEHVEEPFDSLDSPSDTSKQQLNMTTNTIASKLGANTGSDLALAACAYLAFVTGKDTYKRSDILEEMKSATNY